MGEKTAPQRTTTTSLDFAQVDLNVQYQPPITMVVAGERIPVSCYLMVLRDLEVNASPVAAPLVNSWGEQQGFFEAWMCNVSPAVHPAVGTAVRWSAPDGLGLMNNC